MSRLFKYLWIIGLLFTLGLFCTIRDDNGNPVVTDGQVTNPQDTVTVTATPALLASPDSIYVRLRDTLGIQVTVLADSSLKDSLTVLQYVPVKASVNRGRLIRDSLSTDRNGRCRFLFTDSVAGTTDMVIRCNGASITIHFDVSNAPDQIQKLISVLPEKSVILADGKDSTLITCTVINKDHNPIAGECVQFISSAGIIIGNSTTCGHGQSMTGPDGIATAKLISSNINDTAFITAYLVSDRTQSTETEVAFSGVYIKSTSSKNNLALRDTVVITATVLNGSGFAVSRAPVFFSMKSATSNLQILSADSLTNYEGTAVARIYARSNGSDVLNIISSGAASSLQLNVSTLLLKLDINKTILQTMGNDTSVITATFTNATGTALPNRTLKLIKTYKTESGTDTTDTISRTTAATGKTAFAIACLPYEGAMKLEAIGYDNAEGYASVDTMIQFITTRIMTIRAPEFVAADGSSKGIVTVSIKNKNGNPIINDAILFSTNAGTITSESRTDTNGNAYAYITSDRRNMTATVTARLKSDILKFQTIDVDFQGVVLSASAQPPCINSNGLDTSIVHIILTDAATNPVAGERINFSKQKENTRIVYLDSITNNRGEAICKITGTGTGTDTIKISGAGASTAVVLNYSSNVLLIDTIPGQSMIANGHDSTTFEVTYLQGNRITPIPGATVEINYTVGTTQDTLFAQSYVTNSAGKFRFTLLNPSFAVPATVSGLAKTATELTSCIYNIYFKASRVYKVKLTGSSEVINVNGDKSTIYAVAFDSVGNRVKNARIAFNLLAGPSGGEYIDPPYAITGDDGTATAKIISGSTPSAFRQVWISAGDFNTVISDTLKFTISGPPKFITIRTNLKEGINPKDGTYILPCAAIVTDVNGNPVADGTNVTFSLQVSGFVATMLSSHSTSTHDATGWYCSDYFDTIPILLPFEDFNDNLKLDPGEDLNADGILNRGEDLNGDGKYIRGPSFIDVNGNGKRDYNFSTLSVEEAYYCGSNWYFVDINSNNSWDPIEPLSDPAYQAPYYRLVRDSAFIYYPTIRNSTDSTDFAILHTLDSIYEATPGFIRDKGCFDMDYNWNGISDPNTAVSITKTVQTSGGKAINQILYGQTDANHIQVMIWAESQGVRTLTPAQLVLPIVKSDN